MTFIPEQSCAYRSGYTARQIWQKPDAYPQIDHAHLPALGWKGSMSGTSNWNTTTLKKGPTMKSANVEIYSVFFWCPDCEDVIPVGDDGLNMLDYELELPGFLGKKIKCQGCAQVFRVPKNLEFEIKGR